MGRPEAVLMEAVALPRPSEMHARSGPGVERRNLSLSRDSLEREERVLRRDGADDLRWVDLLGVIDGHHEVAFIREPLQRIHPVVRRGREAAVLGPSAIGPG